MLVDTHCHLNFYNFNRDRDAVVERARDYGILRILNPGIDIQTSIEAIELAEIYNEVYTAIGVHPNETRSWSNDIISELRRLSNKKKVVAIGEIGLDYYRDRSPRDTQIRAFQSQLTLALDLKLPVVIHSRNASNEDTQALEDVILILKDWIRSFGKDDAELKLYPGVLHSYSGSWDVAQEVLDLNFFLGITGPITFKKAVQLREVVQKTPLTHQLIETDAPFLTPHPFRGKRNEPLYVKYITDEISKIRNEDANNISRLTTNNAKRLFNW